jgi:hypothetical protein
VRDISARIDRQPLELYPGRQSLSICSGRDAWIPRCVRRSGKANLWPGDRPRCARRCPGLAAPSVHQRWTGESVSDDRRASAEGYRRAQNSPADCRAGRRADALVAGQSSTGRRTQSDVDRAPDRRFVISLRSGDRTVRSCWCPSANASRTSLRDSSLPCWGCSPARPLGPGGAVRITAPGGRVHMRPERRPSSWHSVQPRRARRHHPRRRVESQDEKEGRSDLSREIARGPGNGYSQRLRPAQSQTVRRGPGQPDREMRRGSPDPEAAKGSASSPTLIILTKASWTNCRYEGAGGSSRRSRGRAGWCVNGRGCAC